MNRLGLRREGTRGQYFVSVSGQFFFEVFYGAEEAFSDGHLKWEMRDRGEG